MQNMLIAILKYTKPLDVVDALIPEHRQYLQKLFDQHKLLVWGRLNPRTGGVIITKSILREEFEKILKNDPFTKVSEYTIVEFSPSLYDDCLKEMMGELT